MIDDKDCTTCKHFEAARRGEALICADCPEYEPENTEEVVYLSKWEPITATDEVVNMDAGKITAGPIKAEKYLEAYVWKPRA